MTTSKGRYCIILLISSLLISCSTVPVTGRKQLSLVSDGTMLSMSYQQYNEFMKTNEKSTNRKYSQIVTRVGTHIQKSVEQYFADNNMSRELEGYAWEFNLIENEELNAWCMPGGKVVVYTGILPIARNEAGLAVIMGHEIAHAVAEHGSERMSQGLAVQMGGALLSTALSQYPNETRQLWMTAYGVGGQYGVLLPYGRLHESEADHLGLIFMAMAGYDPNEAVKFWKRMAEKKGGKAPPEFMSTHPADATRIQNIKTLIPKAMPYYEKAKK
ncbi:MAG: M48 family metallopeptidase [Deltaproteobacteria bacterium]|nr:M48 family metallopeptidase [Deltaproteobacteria bacterium]